MKIYISVQGLAIKVKFSGCVHLPFINQIFQYRHASVILSNVGEVYIFEYWRHISALEHPKMLCSSGIHKDSLCK